MCGQRALVPQTSAHERTGGRPFTQSFEPFSALSGHIKGSILMVTVVLGDGPELSLDSYELMKISRLQCP